MKKILFALAALALSGISALAQSNPGLYQGQVPTPAQWNSYFSAKQDVLGFVPVNKAGDSMGGKLNTVAPTTARAGLGLLPGVAPTSPVNGDLWTTSAGLFVRVNGATIGPLVGASGATFAAVDPIVVTFPAGVTTYGITLGSNFSVTTGALDFGSQAAGAVACNATSGAAKPTFSTQTLCYDQNFGTARGSVVQRGAATWGALAPGVTGLALVSNGAGADLSYRILPLTGGGSGANLTASNGGIVYSTASTFGILSGTATANQIIVSGASTTPAWSTSTYPSTTVSGSVLVSATTNAVTATRTPTLGVSGTATGTLSFAGATSGTVILTPQTAAGTPTITFGTTSGTLAASATAPIVLNATTGVLTCPTCSTSSGGGAVTGTAPVAVSAAGVVSITGGAGQVLAGASPAFTSTPQLGVAGSSLGSIAFQNLTSGTITLQPVTGALGTITLQLPATSDTLVGKTTTDTFLNKTIDTAGPNTISVAGVSITANSGTGGAIVRSVSPALTTPSLGVATATSINGVTITGTTGTLTVASAKTLTVNNSLTFTGTDGTSFAFPGSSDTVVTLGATQTLTGKTLNSAILVTPVLGDASATSATITGTAGAGFLELQTQSSTPTIATASANRVYSDASGRLAWFPQVNQFARVFSGTLTASRVYSWPDATMTVAGVNTAQTWSAIQSYQANNLNLSGSTSGNLRVNCAAVCGTNSTITFPGGTTDFSATGGASQFVRQNSAGAAFTVVQLAASDLSNGTNGTGAVALTTNAVFVTPTIGAATASSINGLGITASTGTLTLTNGKTISFTNTLTFGGTDGSTVAFGTGGTVAYVANNLSVFAATTSAQLGGVISDETGLSGGGVLVFSNAPAITNPTLAAATISGVANLSGVLRLSTQTTPAQITVSQNNYNPTSVLCATSSTLLINSSGAVDITGLAGGTAGCRVTLTNNGSFTITLKENSGSSSVGNRFNTGADVQLLSASSATMYYDGNGTVWRMESPGGGGGGGSGTVTSVTCGTGMTGGTITTSGTCNVVNLGTVTSVTCGTGLTGGAITASGTCAINAASASDTYAGTANKVLTADVVYPAETTTTFGATTTFDFATFINTSVTLTGNITTMTLSNVMAGKTGMITFIQDGTGSRTAAFNTIFKFSGAIPTLTTTINAVDVLTYACRTTTFCVASLLKNVKNP